MQFSEYHPHLNQNSQSVFALNQQIAKAHYLKEIFGDLWCYTNRKWATIKTVREVLYYGRKTHKRYIKLL